MAYTHYKNGKWVSEKELTVSVFDLSVLRGYGIFDFFRTYNRNFFRLEDNVNRFFNSAKIIDLEVPVSKDRLRKIIKEGVRRNPNGDLGIRLMLTGGVSKDFITPGRPNLFVLFYKAVTFPAEVFDKGAKIITEPTPRVHARAKSLNYLAAVIAMKRASKAGAIEVLYVDPEGIKKRQIYECSTSNFFAIKNGVLVTPDEGILHGITRKVVLELADDLGIPAKLRPLKLSELSSIDEAFLTAANKAVLPIVKVDTHKIGGGKPGPVTKRLMEAFSKLTTEN